ncbi:cathepsin L1 [Lingula anatina]|uniref:Cathepsin L1 n=1 Tax=Lingula anatina TaxID=7574 RepID=A0A1S3IT84_LINAN|nr:cathepsin L1 [Lingula anatina]|eukprot:XP_013401420.1 cathepsin L1 [Lingula anatina]
MVYVAFLVCLLFSLTTASFPANETHWQIWKKQHHKKYESAAEEEFRKHTWTRNLAFVLDHNSKYPSFTVELNKFADRTLKEMVRETAVVKRQKTEEVKYIYQKLQGTPASFDWRKRGVVPPVHNQGSSGDAVAFAVTDSIDSYHKINTGQLVALSVQETSDCCTRGHLMGNPFACIKKLGGLCSEADYPHSASSGVCHSTSCHPAAQIKGSRSVMQGNETDLQLAVLQNPVVVLVDANHASFQLYRSGVYVDNTCSDKRLDHALLLVGYGSMSGKDYWICKNSWGTNWGMQGYILIARNDHNMCGIATAASLPI